MEQEKPKPEKVKKKIVEIKRGKEIEQAFAEKFEALKNDGTPFKISIEEIRAKVPNYPTGNGHPVFRDGTKGK